MAFPLLGQGGTCTGPPACLRSQVGPWLTRAVATFGLTLHGASLLLSSFCLHQLNSVVCSWQEKVLENLLSRSTYLSAHQRYSRASGSLWAWPPLPTQLLPVHRAAGLLPSLHQPAVVSPPPMPFRFLLMPSFPVWIESFLKHPSPLCQLPCLNFLWFPVALSTVPKLTHLASCDHLVTEPKSDLLAQHVAKPTCWRQAVVKASTVFTAGCQAKGVGDMPQVYSSLVFELEFSFFFFFRWGEGGEQRGWD